MPSRARAGRESPSLVAEVRAADQIELQQTASSGTAGTQRPVALDVPSLVTLSLRYCYPQLLFFSSASTTSASMTSASPRSLRRGSPSPGAAAPVPPALAP